MKVSLNLSLRRAMAVALSVALSSGNLSAVPLSTEFSIPSRLGQVTDQWAPAGNASRVIVIQDLHANREVQTHIQGLLQLFKGKYPSAPIAVEGASVPLDYSPVVSLTRPELKNDLIKFLIQNGEITGSEAYAIESSVPGGRILHGIENDKFYKTHLNLFRDSYGRRDKVHSQVVELIDGLKQLKRVRAYRSGDAAKRVAKALEDTADIEALLMQRVDLEQARQIARALPQTLDYLSTLIGALPSGKALAHAELKEAVTSSLDFYALALVRDEPLAENALKVLSESNQSTAILIAGGFHSAGILEALKRRGVGYVLVTPAVKNHSEAEETIYLSRLLGQHMTPAEVRAQLGVRNALGVVGGILGVAGLKLLQDYNAAQAAAKGLSGMLSHLPVIGALFAGITIPLAVPPSGDDSAFAAILKQMRAVAEKFNLRKSDAIYLAGLDAQRRNPTDNDLTIRTPSTPAGNFRLQSALDTAERHDILGEFDIAKAVTSPNRVSAREYRFVVNLLHGGIGENVGRRQWLAELQGIPVDKVVLGAKGTDLGYFVTQGANTFFVNSAELQLLRYIRFMSTERRPVDALVFQPIVNKDSLPSFLRLLDHTFFLDDRLNPNVTNPRTYREVINDVAGMTLDLNEALLMQHELPGVDAETGDISGDAKGYFQSGGHGQMGVYFILKALEDVAPAGRRNFRFFGNGDNSNVTLHPEVASYMRQEGILVTQFNTPTTPADRKGGKTGARQTSSGKVVADMIELAQAKATDAKLGGSGQQSAFAAAGLDGGQTQSFNTNIYLLDEEKLTSVLRDLYATVGEMEFYRIIAPTYIPKPLKEAKNGKKYIPYDAAIGSVMHNINAWFATDPRGAEILKKHGIQRFLAYGNVSREDFAPVKNVWDIYAQTHTDYSRVDLGSALVVDQVEGLTPPEVEFEMDKEFKVTKGHWDELARMINSLGELKIRQLKSLLVKGAIAMRDAELIGFIRIENQKDSIVDLKDSAYRQALTAAGLLVNEQLRLQDVTLVIDKEGKLSITKKESTVHYEAREMLLSFVAPLIVALSVLPTILQHGFNAGSVSGAILGVGVWATTIGLAKTVHAWVELGRQGLRGLARWRALARPTVIASLNSEGRAEGLTGIVPIAHELRSHRAFSISSRFEVVAHLLDLVTIPMELLHSLVTTLLLRFTPVSVDPEFAANTTALAKAVDSLSSAALLPTGTTATNEAGVVNVPVFEPSGVVSRLRVLFGFNRTEDQAMQLAYQKLVRAAA